MHVLFGATKFGNRKLAPDHQDLPKASSITRTMLPMIEVLSSFSLHSRAAFASKNVTLAVPRCFLVFG